MMLIICDKQPTLAVQYLINKTDKRFVFKQLIELCQLICSAGISDVYKPVKQGKKLQEWVLNNKVFISTYFNRLLSYAYENINMKPKTYNDFLRIKQRLISNWDDIEPKTAIFRYKKGYETDILTDTELNIDDCVNEYRKYLDWKFSK